MSVCRLRRVLLPMSLALGLLACGDAAEHDGPVPPDGSVVVSPPSRTINVGGTAGPNCVGVAPTDDIFPFTYSTFDGAGRPRGNVDIQLILDFAVGTSVTPVMQLLDDNLVPVTVPFNTKTDDTGNLTVWVRMELTPGCEYAGSLTAISGSIVVSAAIDVTV